MKLLTIILFSALILTGCGKTGTSDHEHDGLDIDSTDANRVLYDQVIEIHDSAMAKMGNLYDLKKKLQDQIANTPNMVVEEKKKLERRISNLDSVGQLMMDWMHRFQPLPDSADQERARGYYESELEKIRKVKEAMLEAIAKEKGGN